jgi:hypothetical protein
LTFQTQTKQGRGYDGGEHQGNSSSSHEQQLNQQQDHLGPLTFSPTPSLDNTKLLCATTQADNDQAELMHWHYGWVTRHLSS